jgi:hypothetical protein
MLRGTVGNTTGMLRGVVGEAAAFVEQSLVDEGVGNASYALVWVVGKYIAAGVAGTRLEQMVWKAGSA